MASIPIVRFYQQSFETHPYWTLAFTNGALNGLGDAVAQLSQRVVSLSSYFFHQLLIKPVQLGGTKLHEKPHIYDPLRTLRFFCFGFGLGLVFAIIRQESALTVYERACYWTLEFLS